MFGQTPLNFEDLLGLSGKRTRATTRQLLLQTYHRLTTVFFRFYLGDLPHFWQENGEFASLAQLGFDGYLAAV